MKKLLTILMLLCTVVAWGQTSIAELKRKAEAGDASAQCDLGYKYEKGDGVAQDWNEAVWWYRKSAEQGNKFGQNNLGHCYLNGKGVSQDYYKAVEWFRKAANQGDSDAQTSLGYCYLNGKGVDKDYYKAVEWNRKAAEQGNMYAYYNLGWCYRYGNGVTKDLYKAKEYYEKAVAKGHSSAKDELAEVQKEIDKEIADLAKSLFTEDIQYYQTTEFAMKEKKNGTWSQWSDWEDSNMTITINLDRDLITIYSPETQKLKVIATDTPPNDNSGKQVAFKCRDLVDNLDCKVRLRIENNGNSQIYVDWSDVSIVYNVKRTK